MKRNKWSQEEIDFLIGNVDKMTISELSIKLDRTEKAVRGRFDILGISLRDVKNIRFREWTIEEDKFLTENYHKYTVSELSKLMDRTMSGISGRKNVLGLNNKYQKIGSEGERIYIRNSKNYSLHYDGNTKKLTAHHRRLYEEYHNTILKKEQYIHHINGDKKDNSKENLVICEGISEHRKIHSNLEKVSYQLIKEGFIIFDFEKKEYIANSNRRLIKD